MDLGSMGGPSALAGRQASGVGAAVAAAAAAAAASAGQPPPKPVVLDRAKLVAEREAKEKARVDAAAARNTENTQREQQLKADKVTKNNEIGAVMDTWSKTADGQAYKDVKVLLSTLHTVTWPGSPWKELPLTELLKEGAVKKHYRKAILLVHPDKSKDADPEQQVRADRIFQALNEAFKVCEST